MISSSDRVDRVICCKTVLNHSLSKLDSVSKEEILLIIKIEYTDKGIKQRGGGTGKMGLWSRVSLSPDVYGLVIGTLEKEQIVTIESSSNDPRVKRVTITTKIITFGHEF